MTVRAVVILSSVLLAAPLAHAQSPDAQKSRTSEGQPQAEQAGKLSRQDARYFRDIAQANLAEVQAGKLAQERANADEVKQYAERMIEDHSRMLEQQRNMAQSMAIDLPKQPDKAQQSAMKKLQEAKGERFDRAYMAQMVKDHEKTLKLVRQAAKNARNPELQAMAQKAGPVIEQHLQMAKQISDTAAAGGTGKAAGKEADRK